MQKLQVKQIGQSKPWYLRWWITLIPAAVLVITLTVETTIGNLGNEALDMLWKYLLASLHADFWPWIFAAVAIITSIYLWILNRSLNQALTTSTNLNELDDSMLRLLGSWDLTQSGETQIKLALAELLRDACREFHGHVQRAMILLPDIERNNEYLTVWAHSKMPHESVLRLCFYIGNDSNKQMTESGVAGEVYLKQEIQIARMALIGGKWKCDCDRYRSFTPRKYDPVYRSFVCIPIYGPSSRTSIGIDCLGVVCFDSQSDTIFDSNATEIVLRVFTRRIATSLLIYRLLSQNPQQTY